MDGILSAGVVGMDLIRHLNLGFDPASMRMPDPAECQVFYANSVSLEPYESALVPCYFMAAVKAPAYIIEGLGDLHVPPALVKAVE